MDPLKQAHNTAFLLDNRFPNIGNTSGGSTEAEENIKKRNRLSFVCQNCRKSKTKCDREKPRCGRCIQHGIPCIYDVETQRAPKNPSKDATIARLQKETEYWKQKAMSYMQVEEAPTKRALEDEPDGNDIPGVPVLKASRPDSAPDSAPGICGSDDEVRINLYRSHPSMIMNGSCKREVKPLSENYAITQDIFLSGLLTSVFVDGHKQPAISAMSAPVSRPKDDLVGQCSSSSLSRISSEPVGRKASTNKDTPMGRIGFLLRSVFERHNLEDFCPVNGEYSETLKSFIKEMESLLPPYEIIHEYKTHFYKSVYPDMSFLDDISFEDSLQATLFSDELNPYKVVIRLGNSRLRHKIENLCILLLVLKLSYISLQIVGEGSAMLSFHQRENLERYPIGDETVILVQKVLAAENFFCRANENTVTCLLYIWAFFVYSPEESDFFIEYPSDLIIGLAMMLSMSIGLHRDPSDFSSFKDPSLTSPSTSNHRRMLWLSTVTFICAETSMKGRLPVGSNDLMQLFIDIHSPNALQLYMERVKKDSPVPSNPKHLLRHEYCFKRAQLALTILDLHKLTLTYNESFTIGAIEEARNKIVAFLDENFPLKDFKPDSEDGYHQFESYINSSALHMRIIGSLMILRSSMALFLHFESLLDQTPELLPYYYKYFNQICLESLTLISHFKTFFVNTHKFGSLPLGSFNVTKYIQLAFTSTILGLLAVLMRVGLANSMLLEEYQKEISSVSRNSMKMTHQRLEIMGLLKKVVENTLEEIHKDASEHLRFSYFSALKTLPPFDIIIAWMRKGDLWNCIMKLQNLNEIDRDFLKSLNRNSRFLWSNPSNEQDIIEKLKRKNYMMRFSINQLDTTYQKIKDTYQKFPKTSTYWNHGEGPLKTPLKDIFPTYEDNVVTDGFDKLSSLAALTQNMNVRDSLDARIKVEGQDDIEGNTPNFDVSEESKATIRDLPGPLDELDLFDFLFGNAP